MKLSYINLAIKYNCVSQYLIEYWDGFFEEPLSYFEKPLSASLHFSVNRPNFYRSSFLCPLLFRDTLNTCYMYASELFPVASRFSVSPFYIYDSSPILLFLDAVKTYFSELKSAHICFQNDNDGFRMASEFLSVVFYALYELFTIHSFLNEYRFLPYKLKSRYLGFKYFRSHLMLGNTKTNTNVLHIVKIKTLDDFTNLLEKVCKTL